MALLRLLRHYVRSIAYFAHHWACTKIKRLLGLYAISLAVAAWFFAIIENVSFSTGLWWANVASLTIGYGDVSPSSTLGKAAAMVFHTFWGLYILPNLIAALLQRFIRDRNEYTHEEQLWQAQALERLAERLGVELPPHPTPTTHGTPEQTVKEGP